MQKPSLLPLKREKQATYERSKDTKIKADIKNGWKKKKHTNKPLLKEMLTSESDVIWKNIALVVWNHLVYCSLHLVTVGSSPGPRGVLSPFLCPFQTKHSRSSIFNTFTLLGIKRSWKKTNKKEWLFFAP